MSKAINIVFKWQINSSKFLYLLKPNFIYGDKKTWGFISYELNNNDEEAIKQNVLSLNEESYKNVFEYMRDEVLFKSEYGKYLTLFDYSCYYINNDCSWMGKPTNTPKIKTIVTTSTRTIDNGEDADTKVNVTETDILDEHTININFDFAIPKGKDGVNGEKGEDGIDGLDGIDGVDGNAIKQKTVMIYHTCKRDSNGDVVKNEYGQILPPDTPVGGSWDVEKNIVTPPNGWALYDTVQTPVFMSTKNFCGISEIDNKEPWCAPIQITGADGVAGKDGESIQFVFCLTNDDVIGAEYVGENEIGDGETEPIFRKNNKTYLFNDNAKGVDATHITEYYCMRNKVKDVWTAWRGPYLWCKYGENGQDGDSVEFIYLRSKENITNTNHINPTPADYHNNTVYQQKEYMPTVKIDNISWSDNPSGVSEEYPYEYVAIRKFGDIKNEKGEVVGKKWGKYSDPSLWAKFGKNGQDGSIGQRGRIIYPAGVWNENVSYKVDNNTTPYVTIDNDGKEEYYYLIFENGVVKGKNPLNETPDEPIYWSKMEAFNAVYTDLLVAKYGTIGGSVFYDDASGNKYMFSSEGKIAENKTSYGSEKIYPSQAYRYFLYDKDKTDGTMIDSNTNGMWQSKVNNGTYLDEIKEKSLFVPNILINFSKGDVWYGRGSTIFRNDGSGNLSNGKIEWDDEKFHINANLIVRSDGNTVFEVGDLGEESIIIEGVDQSTENNEEGEKSDMSGQTIINKRLVLSCGSSGENNDDDSDDDSDDSENNNVKGKEIKLVPFIKVGGDTLDLRTANALRCNVNLLSFANDYGVVLCSLDQVFGVIEQYKIIQDGEQIGINTIKFLDINSPHDIINTYTGKNGEYTFTSQHLKRSLTLYANKIKRVESKTTKITESLEEEIVNVYRCKGSNILNNKPYSGSTYNPFSPYISDDTTTLFNTLVININENNEVDGRKFSNTFTTPPKFVFKDISQIKSKNIIKYGESNLIFFIYNNIINFKPTLGLFDLTNQDIYIALDLPSNENMEGNNDDFGNSFNLTIKEGKNAYIEPYWYNGTFIANNIEKGENEITINYYNENGKNVIIPNVRHDLSYFRHQDEDNLPIITINTKGVVDEIIKDDNTQIETDNISGIKQKDERTKIYGDGTIETHNLICHNGTFQGTINANGIYNGELFENNGRLNNITINNLEVNNFSYNGKARLRIDEKAIIENSINESHIIKNVDIWRQNRGRNGYTWEWNEILFEKDIELASNETICVPSIYVWSRRYTPRKRNNDGAYPNVSIDIHMTDENSVIRSNREEKKGDIYQNGEKSENVYVGYLMNHHGVYYDSHRRVSDLTTMPFQYTNNNDKSQTINLKITVRCFVWLEARQGADYAAISFSSTKQPTFFEIGDEGKEKKNINTPDVVVTSSNPSYPLMRVVSDGIIFITKKGDLIISQDDIKIQKGNVTKSLFDLI